MWGVGCVIGEMFFRHPVFTGSSDLDQVAKIVQMCGTIDETSMPSYSTMPDAKNIQFNHAPRIVKQEFSRQAHSGLEKCASYSDRQYC